jgi:hypothetical protein
MITAVRFAITGKNNGQNIAITGKNNGQNIVITGKNFPPKLKTFPPNLKSVLGKQPKK